MEALKDSSVLKIKRYWENRFDIPKDTLSTKLETSKSQWLKENGLIFLKGPHQSPLLLKSKGYNPKPSSATDSLLRLSDNMKCQEIESFIEEAFVLDHSVQLYYTDCSDIESNNNVKMLGIEDAEKILAFKKLFTESEWDNAGPNLGEGPILAFIKEDKILSIAGFVMWRYDNPTLGHCICDIANMTTITHPDFRGQGLATKVVQSLIKFSLGLGLIPQYLVETSNASSMKVAQKAGMQLFCQQYFFKDSETP